MAAEQTLVLLKPDAVQRKLAGEILRRFESRGLEIRAARLLTVDRDLADKHYAEHRDKPFFGELVAFITSATMGATDPANAAPGTIRGDLALSMPDNLVHGSDSPESAEREIALWFGDELG